ncbi:hypothetical protein [Mammaliicoccus sciuri]|uniref:hypothetical protein n=1 Tax=Mammaliicoccus sciuri TaxID=1296 RepID=UPI00374F4947
MSESKGKEPRKNDKIKIRTRIKNRAIEDFKSVGTIEDGSILRALITFYNKIFKKKK